MQQYLTLVSKINELGVYKPAARENMPGTKSLFGYQNRYDLARGFPILTTKKISFKNIVVELLWFLNGHTNIKYLHNYNCHIWDEDAYNYYVKLHKDKYVEAGPLQGTKFELMTFETFVDVIYKSTNIHLTTLSLQPHVLRSGYELGSCGKQYGYQWRNWNGNFDQIKVLIESLRNTPGSRRHIVTAWNPSDLNDLALHPCHSFFQMNCRPLTNEQRNKLSPRVDYLSPEILNMMDIPKYYLDCEFYQRSADTILGVPYNISSYALLTHILASICNMIPGDLIHTFGDVHIYENHTDVVNKIMQRDCLSLPTLAMSNGINWSYIKDTANFSDLIPSNFELIGYNSHPAISAKLSTGLK